jgi:uncharacterized protein (TIGR03437 family)
VQIQVDIPSSDITRPGLSEISVEDSATGVVYPATAWFLTTVDVNVADFVYDALRRRFYITVPAGGTRPNAPAETVVAIDAVTGAVGPSLSIGPKPTLLAISDDSSYLYVYLSGSSSVSRISLATFTSSLEFPLAGNRMALWMDVVPGEPAALAVSQTDGSNSGKIVLYDDGKNRPQASADLLARQFVFLDHDTIVAGGYVNPLYLMTLSSAGVASASVIPGTGAQEWPVTAAEGLVYTTRGRVYNARSGEYVGATGTSGSATFLPGRSRLLTLGLLNTSSSVLLGAFDQSTLTPLGRIQVNAGYASLGNDASRLVAWDSDGVAFTIAQKLLIGHTPLAGPAPAWTAAGATNAATLKQGAVAPGEVLSLFGNNLGPVAGRSLELSAPHQVSTDLGGTQVWFDGLPGIMLYSGGGQVNVVAPYGLAGKSTTKVQLWNTGIPSPAVHLSVAATAPGVFTQDGSGRGAATILNSDYALNTPKQPAAAGSTAVLYGTGGGVTVPAAADGVLTASEDPLAAKVRVLLNGISVPVLHSGSVPGLVPGAIQVEFQIPPAFRPSPATAVQLEVGGVLSPVGISMAVR